MLKKKTNIKLLLYIKSFKMYILKIKKETTELTIDKQQETTEEITELTIDKQKETTEEITELTKNEEEKARKTITKK